LAGAGSREWGKRGYCWQTPLPIFDSHSPLPTPYSLFPYEKWKKQNLLSV
jgi:hypothetical protein